MLKFKRGQKGFTLMELMVVMAILGVLAALVAGGIIGIGASGQEARLAGDQKTLGTAADRFFNDAFPQDYPITEPSELKADGMDLGVGILNWDAQLPQDPRKTFVPDYVKEIPESAALVSWRLDERTGGVFFAEEGALLIPPSTGRMNVAVVANAQNLIPTAQSAHPDLEWELQINKYEAATEVLAIEVPADYTLNPMAAVPVNTDIGDVTVNISTDNPWSPGQAFTVTGNVLATGQANVWKVVINFTSPHPAMTVTHDVVLTSSTAETPGKAVVTLQRVTGAPDYNPASMDFTVKILGKVTVGATPWNVITNPSVKGVYRWTTVEHTTIDVEDIFNKVAGNQSVVIK